MAHAIALGRAVLTHNRADFFRLHMAQPGHAGIVACKEDLEYAALAARIDAAVTTAPILVGQLIRIVKPNLPKAP